MDIEMDSDSDSDNDDGQVLTSSNDLNIVPGGKPTGSKTKSSKRPHVVTSASSSLQEIRELVQSKWSDQILDYEFLLLGSSGPEPILANAEKELRCYRRKYISIPHLNCSPTIFYVHLVSKQVQRILNIAEWLKRESRQLLRIIRNPATNSYTMLPNGHCAGEFVNGYNFAAHIRRCSSKRIHQQKTRAKLKTKSGNNENNQMKCL